LIETHLLFFSEVQSEGHFYHDTHSLTGKVLAVGGIKEKVMAARRACIKTIILPEDCRRDFEELPDYLKEGLDINYATEYSNVFDVAFGS
jgi:ATP-dependent Lon protease